MKYYYIKWNFLYKTAFASRTPDYGAIAPRDPRSLCPLYSTEILNPPPEKNYWVRHCWGPQPPGTLRNLTLHGAELQEAYSDL